MPEYRVTVIETMSVRRVRTFQAATEEDARQLAEAEDWREWLGERTVDEAHIESIEEKPNHANPTPRI